MKNFKINVFLKNVLGVYLIKYFEQKMAFSAIFEPKRAGNRPFLVPFLCISAGRGGLFASFNSLHHHPLPRHFSRQ
jgi:hypothetical protein